MYLLSLLLLFIYILLTIVYQKSYINLHHIVLLIWVIFTVYEVLLNDLIIEYNLLNLLTVYNIDINISLIYDKISICFSILIFIIYIFVIKYSNFYLKEDPFIVRFQFYINIFTLSMILLVQCNNFIFIFFNWELIGISSYLLINYWFNKLEANLNSIQAILYNKIGDITFLLGLVLLINNMNINYVYYLFIISILTKSAQFIFIVWLTNAMLAPTPTSVLLHSCTMVTLGVYLLYRIYNINLNLEIISIFAIITILIAGLNALFENDIKRVIAFSTCSQLGYIFYMMINIDLSLYHLILHGFFKSLLFIISGLIIYTYYNQDIRVLGNLSIYYPNIYLLLLVSILGQLSIPFISSFYSKDLLIEINYSSYIHYIILLIIGTLLTISYSLKLLLHIAYKPNIIPVNQITYKFKYLYILFLGIIPLGYITKNYFTLFIYSDLLYISTICKIITLLLIPISLFFIINFKIRNNYFYNLVINSFYIEKLISKVLTLLYDYKIILNFNYMENILYNSNTTYIINNNTIHRFIYIIYPFILLYILILI